jgi:hypothetical protein
MATAAATLTERLAEGNDAADRQLEAFGETARRANAALHQASTALDARAAELSAVGVEHAATLGETARELARHRSEMAAATETATERLDADSARFNEAMDQSTATAARLAGELRAEIQRLSQTTRANYEQLFEARAGFEAQAATLAEAALAESGRMENASEALVRRQEGMRDALHEIVHRIEDAERALAARIDDLSRATTESDVRLTTLGETAQEQTGTLGTKLREIESRTQAATEQLRLQGDVLGAASDRALTRSGDATRDFERYAARLIDAADRARVQAEKLSEEERFARRKGFVTSLRTITDSLASLGVDLTRAYERSVPDDTWRRYLEGDKTIFVRRLLQRRELNSLEAVQEQYRDNGEFREHVSRYLEHFEDLLEEAREHDPENLVSAAYLSSDVGKLYMLLGRALNRSK